MSEKELPNESDQQTEASSTDEEIAAGGSPTSEKPEDFLADPARRTFLKRAAIGGGGALLGGAASYGLATKSLEGRPADDYPLIDENIFKPKDQRDVVLNFVSSKALNEKHPERNEQYNRLQNKEFNWVNGIIDMYNKPWDNNKPGYTQMDRALQKAGWEPLNVAGSRGSANLQPNTPLTVGTSLTLKKNSFSSRVSNRPVMPSRARHVSLVRSSVASPGATSVGIMIRFTILKKRKSYPGRRISLLSLKR